MRWQTFLIYFAATVIVGLALFVTYVFMVPKPEAVLEEYLVNWQERDYPGIYELLSVESKNEYSLQEVIAAYENFFYESGFELEEIVEKNKQKSSFGQAGIQVNVWLKSPFFGSKYVKYNLSFRREGLLYWKIDWNPALVYPGLQKGESFVLRRDLPRRGKIFDLKGRPLALRDNVIQVGLQPDRVKDEKKLTAKLKEILGLEPDVVSNALNKYPDHPDWFVPVYTLLMDEYRELDPLLRPIPGVVFRKDWSRVYPQGELTGHLTGYLREVNREWIKSHQELDYRIGDLAGLSGVERALEVELRGKPGYRLIIKGQDKEKLIAESEPVAGDDIYLSIDLKYQKAAREVLGDKKGSFVVINLLNGSILALVNNPAYDPNLFSLEHRLTQQKWEILTQSIRKPLFNRAVSGLYPPGSVFKLITASAALDSGLFAPDTTFQDNGEFKVGGNIIRNYQREVFAEHTFGDALTHSINTTFAKVGLRLGKERLIEYAQRYGLEKKTNFLIPSRSGQLGEIETEVELAWTAVGQAEVLVSPLQVAIIVATIANNGKLIEPTLVSRIMKYNQEGSVIKEVVNENDGLSQRIIRKESAQKLQRLMLNVVEEGTGQKARLEGLSIAGKTGTAETGKGTSHAWFAAFTPFEDPQLAMVVFLENGGVGGQDAAPVAKKFIKMIASSGDQE